jgi:hypothetical protein
VQAAPPTLDREGGVHKYSRAFKEVVERCLVKDPSLRFTSSPPFTRLLRTNNALRRPTAAQLLQTPFFRNAKKSSYLVGTILRMHLPFLSFHPLAADGCLQVIYPLWRSVWNAANNLHSYCTARSTRGTFQRICLCLRRPNRYFVARGGRVTTVATIAWTN